VPPGTIRLYHYTRSEEWLDAILRDGVLLSHALGETYGEPNMVWASAQKPAGEAWYVEFWADPTTDLDIGRVDPGRNVKAGIKWPEGRGANVTMVGDVPPDRILTYNRPWFSTYRYLRNDPDRYGTIEQLEALLEGFPVGAADGVVRPAVLHRLADLRGEAGADVGTASCLHCGKAITADALGTFIDDETGGDVCGWDGGNETPGPDPSPPPRLGWSE
jgi:hypothetical protein